MYNLVVQMIENFEMDTLFVLTHQSVQEINAQYWQGFSELDTHLTLVKIGIGSTFMGGNLAIFIKDIKETHIP